MEFIKSHKMKISVLKNQEKMLSSKKDINRYIRKNSHIAFDIINEGNIIGFALLRKFDESCYFLWDYAIDAKYQNRHYGTQALKELIEFMRTEYNMHTMTTTYKQGNNHAKHLYEKIGFTETDVVDEDGIQEVNMRFTV